jgi:hypothetical protein
MKAEVIEANVEGVTPSYLYGGTLLEMGFRLTTEGEYIVRSELYVVTPFGVWLVED